MHKETQLLPYILSIMFLGYFFRKQYDKRGSNETYNKETKNLNTYSLIATLMCLGLPILLLVIHMFGYDFIPHAFRFGMGHTLGFILFFTGLLLLKNSPKSLIWLGTISYSLYLIHPLVMRVFIQISKNFYQLQGFHVSFYMIITAVFSIVVATVIYKLIEKPAIAYARKLTTRNN
jgi:peptidoglycan/LPS O-acetylase OafA/YrhL